MQKMASDFVPGSVLYGLRVHEFDHLPEKDRKKLVRLMARISEASYRRGFQQGAVVGHHCAWPLHDYRYRFSLDRAAFAEGDVEMSSIGRLDCEHHDLLLVGLHHERSVDGCQPMKGRRRAPKAAE